MFWLCELCNQYHDEGGRIIPGSTVQKSYHQVCWEIRKQQFVKHPDETRSKPTPKKAKS